MTNEPERVARPDGRRLWIAETLLLAALLAWKFGALRLLVGNA